MRSERCPACPRIRSKSSGLPHPRRRGPAAMAQARTIPGVKRIVAVASGKGGVGKSTVAVNLALAMRALGWRAGLMDADVYGPSVAMMVGAESAVKLTPERRIIPLERYGIRYVSMALFINDETPVIWRGPMVTRPSRRSSCSMSNGASWIAWCSICRPAPATRN